MRPAITRRIFIAAILVLALLPGLQTLTRLSPEFAVDEQRALAPPPSLAAPEPYLQQANKWFSDHYGFRSLLIRLKATIDYRVFHVSDKVHVGRDGYLFYRSTLDDEKPAMDRYLTTHTDAAIQGITRYAQALHDKGIGMVMVVNLLGDRLIPEKLPKDVAARKPLRHIDDFIEKLSHVPNVTFIDSTAILQATARTRPIFHRTDFHWNDPAAFPVAQAMVDAMSRGEGKSQTVWKHDLEIKTEKLSGGVARFMPLLNPPSEQTLFVKQNWSWPAGFASVAGTPPYEGITTTAPGTPGLLHPVLLVGDSFMDGILRAGFQAYFMQTYRIRWAPGLSLETITAAIPPDTRWMTVQFIEVSTPAIDAFSDSDSVTRSIQLLQRRATP